MFSSYYHAFVQFFFIAESRLKGYCYHILTDGHGLLKIRFGGKKKHLSVMEKVKWYDNITD